MKARRGSACSLCENLVQVGDDIGRWLGSYVHASCREGAKASIVREELPTNREGLEHGLWAIARKQTLRPSVGKTRGIRSLT